LNPNWNDTIMRPSGLTKERKTKNGINAIDSSEMPTPTNSEDQRRACLCVKCGRIFIEPIQLTVHGKGSVDKYCACPHCFSRVGSSDRMEKNVDKTLPENHETDSEETATTIESAKPNSCGHFLGYLKTLSKDSQFPEECYLCTSLIKCKY
jgi:DNA-directed RNA polymerase subunit RPC12/RpoP